MENPLTKYFLIMSMILAPRCASPGFKEQMMADGNTWNIIYGGAMASFSGCNGSFSSDETCIDSSIPHILQRAKELCSDFPTRVFACGRIGSTNQVSCNIQCKKNPKQEVVISEDKVPARLPEMQDKDAGAIKKAKRCQLKGGIWINDLCQIDIGDEDYAH